MEKHRRAELLSPAGNVQGFYGAVHAGADAVYLAGDRFGARAYAENFTTEELVSCIHYGHLLGRKIYLTVNTLLKDFELAGLYDYLAPFYEAGLDAVIVQDLGVFRFIREHFPRLKLHVSTQMTLCSAYGASLLKSMGASRIVPARELSLKELVSIKQTGVEVEAFIHGAMCYSYSGQCLFSSILGGRSGNRGRCAQPCRLPYSVRAEGIKCGNCYPLSLKDMCTIEHIPQLIEAGIDSFKIEGRMKKPEYTAGVTDVYRRYIDMYYELREKKGPQEAVEAYRVGREDYRKLSALYIRSGVQDGYYFKRNGREMITMDSPAYSGSDDALLAEIRGKYLDDHLRLPVTVSAVFQAGEPAQVTLRWQGISATVTGSCAEQARKQPIREENIEKQLGKLGDSAFYAAETEISLGEECFYPLKQLNELRRDAVSALERQILAERGYEQRNPMGNGGAGEEQDTGISPYSSGIPNSNVPMPDMSIPDLPIQRGYAVSVCTRAQLKAVADWFSAESPGMSLRIYVDSDLLMGDWAAVSSLCERLPLDSAVYAALPYILRESDREYLEAFWGRAEKSQMIRGFLVRSMDGLGFVREQKSKMPCRADAGLYVWNECAVRELSFFAEGFCLPYELKASEQRSVLNDFPCEKIVYSRIPLMITANCLKRTADQCRKGKKAAALKEAASSKENEIVLLKDRYHREFPVAVNCRCCMNILYNSVPFSLHREISKWRAHVDLRLDFTLESESEVGQILDTFLKGAPFPLGEYTTGHEKRGVE